MQDVSPQLIVIKEMRWSLILEVLNSKIEAEYQVNFHVDCLALLSTDVGSNPGIGIRWLENPLRRAATWLP